MQTPKKEKANILLVDDQPGKLASYEVILSELDENLLKASSAKEALEILLKTDVAAILVDVCMPELDGFELAQMIREHPRFKDTAIIFISAVLLSELDSLKAYEMGGVDYVSVPVVPGRSASQGASVRRSLPQVEGAGAYQQRAGTPGEGTHLGARGRHRPAGTARPRSRPPRPQRAGRNPVHRRDDAADARRRDGARS